MGRGLSFQQDGFYVEYGTLVKFVPDEYLKADEDNTLSNIVIPQGIVEIGKGVFLDNKDPDYPGIQELESVEIPDSCEIINDEAFFGCKNLTKIEFDGSLEKIGCAFSTCQSLSSFSYFPEYQKNLPAHFFDWCNSIDFNIPNNIEVIEESAFYNCRNLSFSFGKSGKLKRICSEAFSYCKMPETLILPEGLEIIDSCAFRGCYNLSNIIIPSTIKQIENDSFSEIESEVLSIKVPESFKIDENLWGLKELYPDVEVILY